MPRRDRGRRGFEGASPERLAHLMNYREAGPENGTAELDIPPNSSTDGTDKLDWYVGRRVAGSAPLVRRARGIAEQSRARIEVISSGGSLDELVVPYIPRHSLSGVADAHHVLQQSLDEVQGKWRTRVVTRRPIDVRQKSSGHSAIVGLRVEMADGVQADINMQIGRLLGYLSDQGHGGVHRLYSGQGFVRIAEVWKDVDAAHELAASLNQLRNDTYSLTPVTLISAPPKQPEALFDKKLD